VSESVERKVLLGELRDRIGWFARNSALGSRPARGRFAPPCQGVVCTMLRTTDACAAILVFAAVVPAQLTISDGNMNVVSGALSPTAQTPCTLQLRSDATLVNHAFEHWWYYRVAGDTQEFALRNVGTVTQGITAASDHLDRDFMNVDSRSLLRASVDMDVYDSGPASGVVISRLTVMNISASPVTASFFCYTDLDITGTAANDFATGTGSRHFVTDSSGVQIEVRAFGNDRSEIGAYPTIRNMLTNTAVDNLSNTLPPFTGDYTGAFQWDRTFQPLEQRTFTVLLAVDTAATLPPLVENYGIGNGPFGEIHTQTIPLQDNSQVRTFSIAMKGAVPSTIYRTVIGFAPYNAAPFIGGLDFWVDPFAIIGVWGEARLTSATGTTIETFMIPSSPYLTGLAVYSQHFYFDVTAPNGFAYFTPGMMTRIGKL